MTMTKLYLKLITFASIASGIKTAFDTHVKTDMKSITNEVILPVASVILIVALVIRAAFMFFKYRQGEEVGWKMLVGIFVGLIITTTASLWMWGIIGW